MVALTLASVNICPLLSPRDFESCGQPVPQPDQDFSTPISFEGALIILLVVSLATGVIHFGPPLVHFARRILRTLIRRLRRYFGFRQDGA